MDTKQEFTEATMRGQEIEFTYGDQHYFESHNSDIDWNIYCEETKQMQYFTSYADLLSNAILQGHNINEIWDQIMIDYIL